jgi:hypothetical protein
LVDFEADRITQEATTPSGSWALVKESCGRVLRWLVGSVVLAAAPIFVSVIFLPRSVPVSDLLAHGDFAVLAAALVSASLTELLSPDEPTRVVRTVLILGSVLLLVAATVLLCGIAGHAQRLSVSLDVRYSWYVFFVSLALSGASWAVTIHRTGVSDEGQE